MTDASSGPFRWAILGTGVVSRKFVHGLGQAGRPMAAVVAASRNPENAARFAQALGVPRSASYEEAVADPEVDAVYIATPPGQHEAHSLMAIAAGKPVLIEKPFAMNAAAARRIAAAAREAGVFCMEAMWTRFVPLLPELQARLAAGEIGEPRAFEGGFFVANKVDPEASLFDPARGGGALMHRGIYPVSIARALLGPVAEVQAMARIGSTGVDEDCTLVLRHDSGAISTARASLVTGGDIAGVLQGTSGTIRIAAPLFRPHRAELELTPPRGQGGGPGRFDALREGALAQGLNRRVGPWIQRPGKRRSIAAGLHGNGYHYEATALAEALAQGWTEHPLMRLEESIEIMDILDKARAAWGMETGA